MTFLNSQPTHLYAVDEYGSLDELVILIEDLMQTLETYLPIASKVVTVVRGNRTVYRFLNGAIERHSPALEAKHVLWK